MTLLWAIATIVLLAGAIGVLVFGLIRAFRELETAVLDRPPRMDLGAVPTELLWAELARRQQVPLFELADPES
jgi:hypothetical protein